MNDLKNTAKHLKKDRNRKRQTQSRGSPTSSLLRTDSSRDNDPGSIDDNLSVGSGSSVESVRKTILPQSLVKNTTIVFLDANGLKREVALDKRLLTYTELQREIARILPANRDMFLIQNHKGERVFPENFVPSDKVFVRKLLLTSPSMLAHRGMANTWDTDEYHDAKHQEHLRNARKSSVSLFF